MAETKEKLGKDLKESPRSPIHRQAEPVANYYEATDINILRDALLAKHGLKLNTISNLVEPIAPGNPPKLPPLKTYIILPGWGQPNCFDAVAEAVCVALLDNASNKQI